MPLLTATILLVPGSVAFAAQPASESATTVSAYQVGLTVNLRPTSAESERRCLIRCNETEQPRPGARVQEAATKARTAVQEAREDVREAAQDTREAVQDTRQDVREAVGEAKEAVADVKEAAGRAKEGIADAKDDVDGDQEPETAAESPTEAASSEPAPAAAPSEDPAPDVSEPPSTVAAASAPAANVAGPTQVLPSSPALATVAEADPGVQSPVRRADGVAGGPTSSTQRPEPGVLGQGKAPEPAAPAAPVVAAVPPVVPPPTVAEPAGPAAVQAPPVAPAEAAPPVAAPAPAVAANPPTVATNPPSVVTDADDADDASDSPTIKLAGWSVPVPLAVAGGLTAGAAIVVPLSRRRRPASLPAGRALSIPGASPAPAYRQAAASHPIDRPGAYPGEHLTIGDSIMHADTLHTLRPVNNAYVTSPNARLNGSPVPYLQPVGGRDDAQRDHDRRTDSGSRPGYGTNVAGLAWPASSTDTRGDRALA